jgi:hypothetical protein
MIVSRYGQTSHLLSVYPNIAGRVWEGPHPPQKTHPRGFFR